MFILFYFLLLGYLNLIDLLNSNEKWIVLLLAVLPFIMFFGISTSVTLLCVSWAVVVYVIYRGVE